jgi:hypothetical protein
MRMSTGQIAADKEQGADKQNTEEKNAEEVANDNSSQEFNA